MARQSEVSEEAVSAILSYYWQEVRKSMSSLKHSRIHLTNLGDFVIKHWKVDQKIQMLEQFEEKSKLKGLQQMTARFKTAENLYELRTLRQLMEEEKQRADFIKMYKQASDESKRQHNPRLES